MELVRECQDLLLPFSSTHLERAELEIVPKNQAIYIQDKPAYIPDTNTSRSLNSVFVSESLKSESSRVKFKLSPIKYIIPDSQSSVFEQRINNYYESKTNLLDDILSTP